jgi:tRNA modification GTPase
LGIEVAERYLDRADLVLFCVEAGRVLEDEESAVLERWKGVAGAADGSRGGPIVIVVRTKADLSMGNSPDGALEISVEEGTGFSLLRRRMLEAVFAGILGSADVPLVTRERQRRMLRKALLDTQAFVTALDTGLPSEIAVTHVLDALQALEEMIGTVGTEDVLDLLFSSFCVGK